MGDPESWVRLIKELGPVWGPPALFLLAGYWLLRYRWNKGHRDLDLFWDRWVLVVFLVGVVFFPGYYYYRYRYWGLPPSFEKGEIGILIGEVPGDTNQQQQAAYAREVRALVQKTPGLGAVIKIKMLERPLPADPQEQQAKALQWGRWLRATFVLRPNVVGDFQEPWITVVDQPEFSTVEAPMGKFQSAQLANLDQLPLPSNLLLLARCALALAFYRQGSYEHVAGELQDVLAAQGLPELAPSRSYLTLTYANALYLLRKNDEAITQFKRSIALKPGSAEAHNNLGVALDEKHDLDGAIAEYREALRLKPEDAEAHYNLGIALRDKHDLDGAMAEYREALRLEPDYAEAHNNLGNVLRDKHDQNGAMAEWREALRLKPGLAEAHNNLGNAFREKHDLDGAMSEDREALRLKPDYAEAHINLGNILRDKHDLDGAMAEYRKALRLKPGLAEAHINLGVALHEKGDPDGALAEYRAALRLKPDFAEAHANLGDALRDKGDVDGAIAEYREALQLDPNLALARIKLRQAIQLKADKVRAPGKVHDGARPQPK